MSEALECILRRFAEELTAPSTDAMPNRIERMARRYAEEYGSEYDRSCDAIDVLRSIDQLRRDLSGYHGQLKAHNDLQAHCDRQREQLAALGAAHKPVKAERDAYKRQAERLAAENAKLREERDHWRVEQVHAYGNWEDTYKRASELEAENAKLREQIHLLKNGDILHVLTDQELADQQKHEREVQASITALESENAKLRDAMYTNAGKRSLQHMDEDELRIWATQQSEYIEELKELVREMRSDLLPITCPWVTEYDKRMRELGVVVE